MSLAEGFTTNAIGSSVMNSSNDGGTIARIAGSESNGAILMDDKHIICYLCGQNTIVWDEDTDVDEDNAVNSEEVGILHQFHCLKCGARVSVFEERKGGIR